VLAVPLAGEQLDPRAVLVQRGLVGLALTVLPSGEALAPAGHYLGAGGNRLGVRDLAQVGHAKCSSLARGHGPAPACKSRRPAAAKGRLILPWRSAKR